jgi:co-chaperonin GroES (HSP10)
MIKAPKGRILIEDYNQKLELPSGIIVPETAAFMENSRIMMIRSVGDGVDPELKPGQRIITKTFMGILVEHEGEKLRSCLPEDVLLLIDG